MWTQLRPWLLHLDPIRIEDAFTKGIPDVNYVHGWIELKALEKVPVRPTTILSVNHFTAQQRIWLDQRWKAGGLAWLLLKAVDEWLLFDGSTASRIVGRVPLVALRRGAVWIANQPDRSLIDWLCNRPTNHSFLPDSQQNSDLSLPAQSTELRPS